MGLIEAYLQLFIKFYFKIVSKPEKVVSLRPLLKNKPLIMPIKIRYSGVKDGIYEFLEVVDDKFFETTEHALISRGKFDVKIIFEKRYEYCTIDVSFLGIADTACDRCGEDFNLPLKGAHKMIVKFSEEIKEDDDEVMYVSREIHEIDVTQLVYETIVLSLPTQASCPLNKQKKPSCGFDPSKYFSTQDDSTDESAKPSIWDALKGLKEE